MDRYPEFVFDLVAELAVTKTPFFAEVMDKRFYVAANLVSYVFGAAEFRPSGWDTNAWANGLADVLFEYLEPAALGAYCDFAKQPNDETFVGFVDALRYGLLIAKLSVPSHMEHDFEILHQAEKRFERTVKEIGGGSDECVGKYLRLIPPPDQTTNGKPVALLPHVSAFAHIYGRINHFALGWHKVRVVHDEQRQFGSSLSDCATTLTSNEHLVGLRSLSLGRGIEWDFPSGKLELAFADSATEPGIQVADVIARLLTRHALDLSVKTQRRCNNRRALDLLSELENPRQGLGVNIVASTKWAERFRGGVER
jgi:hypothetical protein